MEIKMARKAKKQTVTYKDYQDYLKSEKWKQVKEDYADNEQTEQCLCCLYHFDSMDELINHHHWKYEKDWNNDSWKNLIILCNRCHDFAHKKIKDGYEFHSRLQAVSLLQHLWTYEAYYSNIQIKELIKDIAKNNVEVSCNREGEPYLINILEPITIKNFELADELLKAQKEIAGELNE